MGIAEIGAFLHRLMTDKGWRQRLLDDPETAMREMGLNAAERWAVLEALWDSDERGHDFLPLLRTRLALVGVLVDRLPADLLPPSSGQGTAHAPFPRPSDTPLSHLRAGDRG
jgi:hypothetical protein